MAPQTGPLARSLVPHDVQTGNTIDVLALFRNPLSKSLWKRHERSGSRGHSGTCGAYWFRSHSWAPDYWCTGYGRHLMPEDVMGTNAGPPCRRVADWTVLRDCAFSGLVASEIRTFACSAGVRTVSDTPSLLMNCQPVRPIRREERQSVTMIRRTALLAGLFVILPVLAAADPGVQPEGGRAGSAVAESHDEVRIVEASCASLCRQRHNQCRIATRGAPSCDADLQRCLKGCLASKQR